jgi:hypothetical protein
MGKISKEKVEELKKQHRIIVPVELEDEGEILSCYLKRPTTETLAIVNKLSKTDEVKAAEILIKQCWVEGDSIIKEDGILMLAVAAEFGQANKVRATILKNE